MSGTPRHRSPGPRSQPRRSRLEVAPSDHDVAPPSRPSVLTGGEVAFVSTAPGPPSPREEPTPVFSRFTLMSLDSIQTDKQQWVGDIFIELLFAVRKDTDGYRSYQTHLASVSRPAWERDFSEPLTSDSAFAKLIFWPTLLNCTEKKDLEIWLRDVDPEKQTRIYARTPREPSELQGDFAFYALSLRFRGTFTQNFVLDYFPWDSQLLTCRLTMAQTFHRHGRSRVGGFRYATFDEARGVFALPGAALTTATTTVAAAAATPSAAGVQRHNTIASNHFLSGALSEWRLHPLQGEKKRVPSLASLSSPDASGTGRRYSHLTLLIHAEREPRPFFFSYIVPFFLVLCLTPFIMFAKPTRESEGSNMNESDVADIMTSRLQAGTAIFVAALTIKAAANKYSLLSTNSHLDGWLFLLGSLMVAITTALSVAVLHGRCSYFLWLFATMFVYGVWSPLCAFLASHPYGSWFTGASYIAWDLLSSTKWGAPYYSSVRSLLRDSLLLLGGLCGSSTLLPSPIQMQSVARRFRFLCPRELKKCARSGYATSAFFCRLALLVITMLSGFVCVHQMMRPGRASSDFYFSGRDLFRVVPIVGNGSSLLSECFVTAARPLVNATASTSSDALSSEAGTTPSPIGGDYAIDFAADAAPLEPANATTVDATPIAENGGVGPSPSASPSSSSSDSNDLSFLRERESLFSFFSPGALYVLGTLEAFLSSLSPRLDYRRWFSTSTPACQEGVVDFELSLPDRLLVDAFIFKSAVLFLGLLLFYYVYCIYFKAEWKTAGFDAAIASAQKDDDIFSTDCQPADQNNGLGRFLDETPTQGRFE